MKINRNKKKKSGVIAGFQRSAALRQELELIFEMMEHEEWDEAADAARALYNRFPNDPIVVNAAARSAMEVRDDLFAEVAAERLVGLDPKDPDASIFYVFTLMNAGHVFLGVREAERVFAKWPNHPEVKAIHEAVEKAQDAINTVEFPNVDHSESLVLMAELEDAARRCDQGNYGQARTIIARILKRHPSLPAALNALSDIAYQEGNIEESVGISQKAIASDPNDPVALGDLIKYSVLLGREEQVRHYAERLKGVMAEGAEPAIILEGLTWANEMEAVVTVYRQISSGDDAELDIWEKRIAAHALRSTGRVEEARELWEQNLRENDEDAVALANLEDLGKLIGEQHGSFVLTKDDFISRTLREKLGQTVRDADGESDEAIVRAYNRLLKRRPEVTTIFAALLALADAESGALSQS